MRDPIENINHLQSQINDLQLENQILKNILDTAGISYRQKLLSFKHNIDSCEYDQNQGARIEAPKEITEKMANYFFSRFWGRQDVYAKRYEKKDTKEASYFPQCENFWKENCYRRLKQSVTCKECKYRSYKALTKNDILAHLRGTSNNASDVIGVYPLFANGTCRFLVFDFDNHEKEAEKQDFANKDNEWIEEVQALRKICMLNGVDPLVERSRSGKGAHIWIFFDSPIPASLARKFGTLLLDKGAEQINLKSFKYYDRMLPAQDKLEEGSLGNLIALPLQGKALKQGNSAFVDENWNAYKNQWEVLFAKPKLSEEFIELKIKEWTNSIEDIVDIKEDENREKPWQKNLNFSRNDVDDKLLITLSNGIYIDNTNIKPRLQNKIRRMAAMSNPIYYRNQAIGTSNYDQSRFIYLGKDHLSGYIEIPRGLYDPLIKNIELSKIPYEINDERQTGKTIDVSFKGVLRNEQVKALHEMMRYENGMLHAATAFGKTVVCSAIIAEKKVNTLIILESSSLMGQWENALNKFLVINEKLPEYKTKTGIVKTRKEIIGKLQGAHDSMTGIIDIAMAGSLYKKGEFHNLLNQYGMIIVDECHHAASDTIAKILKEAKAKHVYGVTATPKRGDGLEKINYMLIGPIRHSYTAKEKAKAQGIGHYVYPRFTPIVPPRGIINKKMHPNEAYDIIRDNDIRDDLIVEDIKECINKKRTPVVLSKYKDHSMKLYERLKDCADYVFLLTGNNSKKETQRILEQLHQVKNEESIILIATGSLIGEGFDYPRLDTLFMATPVSFESIVTQYVGRLNRDYPGKENVIVYDYVDSHIPMFNSMYIKRLKAYKQNGFEICSGLKNEKQNTNAIFDYDNYYEVYKKDLLEANKNIVISSPIISRNKVYELIDLLHDQRLNNVEITIVTLEPDLYKYSNPIYWMQLHEEMRQAGIYIKLVEETYEHFAIIDQEVVWYGNMNLLAKNNLEDSMMRVKSKSIAAELMELTFKED